MISLAKNVIFYLPSLLKIIDESETSLLLSFEIRFVLFTTFIMNKLFVERKQKLKMKMHSGYRERLEYKHVQQTMKNRPFPS